MSESQTDQYLYDLEEVMEKLLAMFDPTGETYTIETYDGGLTNISQEMAVLVDRAFDVLYGEPSEYD